MKFPSNSKRTLLLTVITLSLCFGVTLLRAFLTESTDLRKVNKAKNEAEVLSDEKQRALQIWRDQFDEARSLSVLKSVIELAESENSWASATALDEVVENNRFSVGVRLLASESLARASQKKSYQGLKKATRGRHRQLRLSAAEALIRCGHKHIGFEALFSELRSKQSRREAIFRLRRLTGQKFQLDPHAGPAEVHKNIEQWKLWIAEQGPNLKIRPFHSQRNKSNS